MTDAAGQPGSAGAQVRRYYQDFYSGPSAWREVRAREHADRVTALCGGVPHESILDIGCGEGAVLAELARRGFGQRLAGLEISPSGVAATQRRGIPGLTECRVYDGQQLPYADQQFDLALLVWVLAYAESPRLMLAEAARVARHVFVVAALSDNRTLPPKPRNDDGVINHWSPRSLRYLALTSGLSVERELIYNPAAATAAFQGGWRGRVRQAVKGAGLRIWPRLATSLWTYETALLVTRRESGEPPLR